MKYRIANADIYSSSAFIPSGFIDIIEGRVNEFGTMTNVGTEEGFSVYDAKNWNVSAGWCDLQVNGIDDMLFEDVNSIQDLRKIGDLLLNEGVTRWFGALISTPRFKLDSILDIVASGIGKYGLSGVHLEGPWINPRFRGCHPIDRIGSDDAYHKKFIDAVSEICPIIVSLAPECVDEDYLKYLEERKNVKVFASHTDNSWISSVGNKVDGITHILNAMEPFKAREPGACGWLMGKRSRRASIICDGFHVHRQSVEFVKRAAWPEQLFIVSDIMPVKAVLGGRVNFLKGATVDDKGTLRTYDGTLAGSGHSLRHGLKFLVQRTGIPMAEAVRMAATYPYNAIDRMGFGIEKECECDLVIFDNQFNVEVAYRY